MRFPNPAAVCSPLSLAAFGRFGVHLPLEQASAQDLHRGFAILGLAALVLAGDDDPGRNVRKANGRARLVHMLAARAGGAIGIHANVVVLQVDLGVRIDLRQHFDEREGGVAPMGGVEWREPHQPVRASFALDVAVGVLSANFDGGVLDPRFVALGGVQQLALEPAQVGPFQVHAGDHFGPVLGVDAAFTRVDDQDGVLAVVGTVERQLELERVELRRCPIGIGRDASRRTMDRRPRAPSSSSRSESRCARSAKRSSRLLSFTEAAHGSLRGRHVVPEVGFGGIGFELFDF